MKKIYIAENGDNPQYVGALRKATMSLAGQAVDIMLEDFGTHPVTAIAMFIDCYSMLLRNMDRQAANAILKELASERINLEAQKAALSKLVSGYEKKVSEGRA